MALLYGLFCSWVVVLRRFAARKHNRLKKTYENADKAFRAVERDCKNDEVAVGRPADYTSQLKLMKLYDSLDHAKQRWIKAKRKLSKRERMEERIKGLQGRKVPYTFGLLDMAIVLKLSDLTHEVGRLEYFSGVTEMVQSYFM